MIVLGNHTIRFVYTNYPDVAIVSISSITKKISFGCGIAVSQFKIDDLESRLNHISYFLDEQTVKRIKYVCAEIKEGKHCDREMVTKVQNIT